MRHLSAMVSFVLQLSFASGARAQDLCPILSHLITNPPAGFLDHLGEPAGPQQWLSDQGLPASHCVVWEARAKDADDMRCTINDGSSPQDVGTYYKTAGQAIAACLAGLPNGAKYLRRISPVIVEGLTGEETTWVLETDIQQVKVHITRYLRTADSSAYNSFAVQFLHY